MLISAAKYEMHLATAKNLETHWNYTKIAVPAQIENPTLFHLNSKWYMIAGTHNGTDYDLYSTEDFRHWVLVKENWFQDEGYTTLPSGSTCVILKDVLYHIYQIPTQQDCFQLSLAYIEVEDLIVDITKK